ncbi:MAG: hypothetical protein HKP58_10935 [Desulfatitalea sp.]|nr:hypothetical protein [Desulfatitalea sp.]NNK00915.1 hypothetical protein [Desulfatitalea sp.]
MGTDRFPHPNIAPRMTLLQQIYTLHENFCRPFEAACRKGCCLCCTTNVTLTELEARRILRHWQCNRIEAPLAVLDAACRQPRFRPQSTINQLALQCLRNESVPDDAADPAAGPCPLLSGNSCSVYAVRPLACRAMCSRSDCASSGAADMPEAVLAANNMVAQYIEALDNGRPFGNLIDMLQHLLSGKAAAPDREETAGAGRLARLPINQPIPVLMVPPDMRERLQPLHIALNRLFLQG